MDQKSIYVNIEINGTYFIKAIFDNGCYNYMVVFDRLQKKLQFPTFLIRPRTLEQIAGIDYEAINQMDYFDIDIDGYKQRRVWAYVIPHMIQHVLLGLF
jgi:hypothetical protein